jgi:hypothetical protein
VVVVIMAIVVISKQFVEWQPVLGAVAVASLGFASAAHWSSVSGSYEGGASESVMGRYEPIQGGLFGFFNPSLQTEYNKLSGDDRKNATTVTNMLKEIIGSDSVKDDSTAAAEAMGSSRGSASIYAIIQSLASIGDKVERSNKVQFVAGPLIEALKGKVSENAGTVENIFNTIAHNL